MPLTPAAALSPSRRPNFSKGYAAVFATVIIWALPSLFQFYLNRYYDPWSQNFYRYSTAFLAILPFVVIHQRRNVARVPIDRKTLLACFWACLPNTAHQVLQVVALFYIGPGVYGIFGRSSVIFTALLALLFFPEERHIIRQWRFIVGTLLGLLGAFGVIWYQAGLENTHIPPRGFVIAFAATFCWSLYGVLIKRPSAHLGPIRSFGIVSFITSSLLLPLTLWFGRIDTPLRVALEPNLILIVSAVVCITAAHVLYYIAIREIGVALAQTLQLLCPVGGMLLSAWIFHERLGPAQLWSSTVLLLGAFLAMRVKPPEATEVAENI